MKRLLLLIACVCWLPASSIWAQSISSLSAESGAVGEELIIKGSNLPTAANAQVWFGSAAGEIIASSAAETKVTIPAGTRYDFLRIIDKNTGKQAFSKKLFLPTFSGEAFDPAKMAATKYFSDLTGIYDLTVADFNLDGRPDVVTTHASTPVLRIYQNASTVITNPTFAVSTPTMSYMTGGANSGDVDGDGKPDLLLSGYSSNSSTIYLLPNTSTPGGAIQFGSAKTVTLTIPGAAKASLYDLNADGKPELILSNAGSGILTVFKNSSTLGSISFDASPLTFSITNANNSFGLSVADFNGDGKLDVCLSANQENKLYVLQNTSTGTDISFADAQVIATEYGLIDLKVADFSGDGKADIAVSNISQSAVYILQNTSSDAAISFAEAVKFSTNNNPWGMDVGDLNGDQKIDLVVGHLQDASVVILENTGSGNTISFSKHSLPQTNKSRNLRVADLTADGKADIVFTGTTNNQLGIIRNAHCIQPALTTIGLKSDGSVTLCEGTTKVLTATSIPGATYQWFVDGVPLTETTAEITISSGGVYDVQVTSAEGCTASTNSIRVNELTIGVGSMAFEPIAPVCEATEFTLRIPALSGAEYTFSGPNGYSETTTNSFVTIANATAAMAGVYQVVVTTDACEFTVVSDPVEIIANDLPPVYSSAGQKICKDGSLSLSTTAGAPAYQWYFNGVALTQAEAQTSAITVGAGGEYTVKVTNTNGCVRESEIFNLQEVALPVASFTFPPVGCLNFPVQFSNNSVLAAGETPSFHWIFGDGGESDAENPTHVFADGPGMYTITLEVGYQGLPCREIIQQKIELIEAPEIQLIASADSFCQGDSVWVEPSLAVAAAVWSDGSTEHARYLSSGGTHTVEFLTESGCQLPASITLAEIPLPKISITSDKSEVSPGEPVMLTATGGIAYIWDEHSSLDFLTGAMVTANPTTATTYTVWGESEAGCLGSAEITIAVDESFQVKASKMFIPSQEGNWQVAGSQYYPDVQVRILNELGQVIFEEKGYKNTWNGTQAGKALPAGVYYYFFLNDQGKVLKSGSITLIR